MNLVVGLLWGNAVIVAVGRHQKGEVVNISDCCRRGWGRMGAVLGAVAAAVVRLILFIIALGVVVAVLATVFWVIVAMTATGPHANEDRGVALLVVAPTAAMVFIGLVGVVLVGLIYPLVRLFFTQQEAVLGEVGGLAALKGSYNLTAGKWWSVFGLILVIASIQIAASWLVGGAASAGSAAISLDPAAQRWASQASALVLFAPV
jgi:hypothetical protein